MNNTITMWVKYVSLAMLCFSSPLFMQGQVNTVSGNIFVDHDGNGTSDGVDYGHPAIRVKAMCDTDGSGTLTAADQIGGVGFTDINGDYTITLDHTPGTTITRPIQFTADDVEEYASNGFISRSELALNPDTETLGIRFNQIEVPACATITNAYIRFVASASTAGGNLNIAVEDDVDPTAYNTKIAYDVTTRNYLASTIAWNTGAMTAGSTYNTPDLSGVLNTIIDQAGWQPFNAIGFKIDGAADVDLTSYDDYLLNGGPQANMPHLVITYTMPVSDYFISICTEDLSPSGSVSLNSDQTITAAQITSGTNLTGVDYGYNGPPIFCYTIADNGFGGNQMDEFVAYNRQSGTSRVIGSTGTYDIEAFSISPDGGIFYVFDSDQFGMIDPATGLFTPIGAPIGSLNGANGVHDIVSIDGLAFDINGDLWATERVGGGYDYMIKVDPATGQAIPNAFGTGIDYVVLVDNPATLPDDIDDIAVDPVTGILYAIANKSTGAGGTPIVDYDVLVSINKETGELTEHCIVMLDGENLNDIEGFTFTNSGIFQATTGKDSKISSDQNQMSFQIDVETCQASEAVYVGAASDYETCDCLTGAPNEICGFVYIDAKCNNLLENVDTSVENVKIKFYQDTNENGTIDSNDMIVDSVFTDANGYYTWTTAYNVMYPVLVDVGGTIATGLDPYESDTAFVDFSVGFGGMKDSLDFPYCPPITDLRLGKTVSTGTAAIGEIIDFTLTVYNEGETSISSIVVCDTLSASLAYQSHSPASESFDGTTWNVSGSLAPGDSVSLVISAEILAEGVITNTAEIKSLDGIDFDSDPNNNDPNEDDISGACVSVPVILCDGSGETLNATAEAGFTTYQWYKDDVAISGATTDTYIISEAGEYTYTVDDAILGECGGQLCCPLIVVFEGCCPPTQCIKPTIIKLSN